MTDFLRDMMLLTAGEPAGEVHWYVKDGEPVPWFICNDMFWWGCADAEDITEADLPLLRQTRDDLIAAGDGHLDELASLYCARKRGMRPQGAWYRVAALTPQVQALFDACGPERETGLGNPQTQADQ